MKLLLLFLILGSAFCVQAQEKPHIDRVNDYFMRVTGSRENPTSEVYLKVSDALLKDDRGAALDILLETNPFYFVTLRSIAGPLYTRSNTQITELEKNDFEATFMGFALNNRDARELLTTDTIYFFSSEEYVRNLLSDEARAGRFAGNTITFGGFFGSQNGYEDFGLTSDFNIRENINELKLSKFFRNTAGLLTSYAWSEQQYKAGTNRRPIAKVFESFLCAPIEEWRDTTLSDHWVGVDIDRKAGGNPHKYQEDCSSCHAPMDAMRGAFGNREFIVSNNQSPSALELRVSGADGRDVSDPRDTFDLKFKRAAQYNEGYVPSINSYWENLLTTPKFQARFGWRGPTEGRGTKAFGEMIANSEAFSKCMVKRVYKQICRKDAAATKISELSKKFETEIQYRFKDLFKMVSLDKGCIE